MGGDYPAYSNIVYNEDFYKGRPHCPHCGDMAPYGDERHIWIRAHMDSAMHALWWRLKRNPSYLLVALIGLIIGILLHVI